MIWIIGIGALVILEQGITWLVERRLKQGEYKYFAKGHFRLTCFHNEAAAFGKFGKYPKLVIAGSVLALLALVGMIFPVYLKQKNGIVKTGLGFIVAGGISNVTDRLLRRYVVDYCVIYVKRLKKLSHTIFNLADVLIFSGVLLFAGETLVNTIRRK